MAADCLDFRQRCAAFDTRAARLDRLACPRPSGSRRPSASRRTASPSGRERKVERIGDHDGAEAFRDLVKSENGHHTIY